MRSIVPASLVLLLLAAPFLTAAAAQEAPVFVPLGVDPTGDDQEGWITPTTTNEDTSDADDIVSFAVSVQGENLVFKMGLVEVPDSADLQHGQTCWMPAFQVDGGEDEFVGLMCGQWIAGEFQGWVARDTTRGTEVATAAEFVAAEKAILITVPLAKVGAAVGDRLTDLYCLTYFDQPAPSTSTSSPGGINGLYVNDVAPNAKSTAAATVSFGNWTIGSSTAGGDAPVAAAIAFYDVGTGGDATIDLGLNESSTGLYVYNWSYAGGDLAILANVTVLGGNLSIDVLLADNSSAWSGAWSENNTLTGKLVGLEAGPLQVRVNATAFMGSVAIDLYTKPPETGGADATDPAGTNETAANETAGAKGADEPVDTPGLPFFAAVAGLVAVVALRRRK